MAELRSKQKMNLIASTFLFENVNEIIVERMVSDDRCMRQQFPKGTTIFDETHFRHCLGIVLSGTVRVDKTTPDGKLMKMSVLSPGECFGAAAMFQKRDRYATVLTAEKQTDILFLPEDLILWAMHRDFTITENYIRYLSNRIWFLNEKISSLTAGTAEQRLAVFLAEHGGTNRTLSTSMTDLSCQLNIGRASLYRALDTLEERELISRAGKTLHILDPDGLRTFALSK